jgi:hypothetical protein
MSIIFKGKAKDFPVFMKNLRKSYAKKQGKLITKKTLLSEVVQCLNTTQK